MFAKYLLYHLKYIFVDFPIQLFMVHPCHIPTSIAESISQLLQLPVYLEPLPHSSSLFNTHLELLLPCLKERVIISSSFVCTYNRVSTIHCSCEEYFPIGRFMNQKQTLGHCCKIGKHKNNSRFELNLNSQSSFYIFQCLPFT